MELPPKPGHVHNLEFIRILTPYVFIKDITEGKCVLDVGSGSGHGTWLIAANKARSVTALDCDQRKAQEVRRMCVNFDNCDGLLMDAQEIGFKDGSFQIVTCFEVIEHVKNPRILISELSRILRRDGLLILTTPNRAMRLLPLQRPWNREHVREYSQHSLRRYLRKGFPFFEVLGVYGEPVFHEYYRSMWKQHHFTMRRLMRMLIPSPIRRRIMDYLGHGTSVRSMNVSDVIDIPVPAPDRNGWPFHLAEVSDECLNFLAVCGVDRQAVRETTNRIKTNGR